MRWVLVSGDFVTTGGMDRANLALALALAARGDEVHVVAHCVDAALARAPGVRVHRVVRPAGMHLLGAPWLDREGRRVARAVGGARVVVNGGNCRWNDVNWVHYVHAAYAPSPPTGALRRAKARRARAEALRRERAIVAAARVVVCNSRRTQRDVVERLGVPASRTRLVHYPADAARFRPAEPRERAALRERLGWPQDGVVALFIGALGDGRKGFDTLYAAWAMRRAVGREARLVVVGAGAQRATWERRARDDGAHVEFLGRRDDVHDLLRAADLLASPTRYEAFGLAVHEALCCGTPAIVSADAGVAELYPDALRDLLLPRSDDAVDLARRIERCLQEGDRLRAAARACGDALRRHDAEAMARQFIEAVEPSIKAPESETPLVSIVVPAFRRPEFLRAALRSAVGQTWRRLEIVVSEDGGSEGGRGVVDEIGDARVRYRRNDANLGVAGNTLAAMREARGAFIANLSDDDLFEPGCVETLVAPLWRRPGVVLSFADHAVIDAAGAADEAESARMGRQFGRDCLAAGLHADWRSLAVRRTVPMSVAALFRRDAIDLGEFPMRAGSFWDWMLACVLCASGGAAWYTPTRVSRYRIHPRRETAEGGRCFAEAGVFCASRLIADPFFASERAALRRVLAISQRRLALVELSEGRRRAALGLLARSAAIAPSPRTAAAALAALLPASLARRRWKGGRR